MPVVEVEIALQQLARLGVLAALMLGDEPLALLDQRHQDAAHQVLAGRKVVVQRGFGDAQPVGDVLQAGALHPALGKQFSSDLLDALSGVRPGPAHPTSLTDLPISKPDARLTER
ncbi:hypothetical protein MOKP125_10890 [Mycobacterium avium subsp. hominissuis]